jgi:predicted ATPase/DNA-binding SARP family transcriptional activator/DNA-binding CsgD family transcriptional regulator
MGTAMSKPEAVRVGLLGGFRVSVGSRVIGEERWRLRKARSLVKLLALSRGRRLHREQVMEALWPGLDPEAAANNLYYALHVARRALEPAARPANGDRDTACSRYLLLRDEQLLLCPDSALWVDVEAFEEAALTARSSREPAAFRAAIDLYSGELLPGDRYEGWLEERRSKLKELYLSLLVELAALLEERKEYEPAIEALGRSVAEEPAREEAHLGLMRLYALSGRRREALGQYEHLRETLFRKYGTEPDAEVMRLQREIWAGTFPRPDSPAAGFPADEAARSAVGRTPAKASGKHNLPLARTSFVGREREVLEVKRLLAMTKLLTLTGTGGCGKTRLALEVARDLVGSYPDGVWLIELVSLADAALVPQAVAQALGVREQPGRTLLETLEDVLRKKKTLLVVDNCEHLVETVAEVVNVLLACCPNLRILATGRERLNTAGEVTYVVHSLTVPGSRPEAYAPLELEAYESVRLFVDRARQRDPSFALSVSNARAVAEVCRRLEGMPLAVELAASRVGVLSARQIAERLEDPLNVLTGGERTASPSHRTMRATLSWSHALLGEPERVLVRRLSVFAGRWTLEAAEGVCSAEPLGQAGVLEALSGLVERSLVVAEPSAEEGAFLRYRMLEPIRQYALEKLKQSGESEALRSRHAAYYLELAERMEPALRGKRPMDALKDLRLELANFRAALSWALDADDEVSGRDKLGLRLAAALAHFWDSQAPGEGRRWLEKGLLKSGAAPASVRAKALHAAGFIAVYEGDPKAMVLLEESLALYKELGDRSGVASSMSSLGHAVVHVGNRERMLSLREEAEAMLSEPLDRWESAHLLLFLGLAAGSELDHETMGARTAEALVLFREVEDSWGVAMCLPILGYCRLAQHDPDRAAVLFEEGLHLQRGLRHKTAIFMGVLGLGVVAVLRGEARRAARLIGASAALRKIIGLSLSSSSWKHFDFEGCIAAARAELSQASFEAAWAEGQAMSSEEAIEYALSEEEHEPSTPDAALEQPPSTEETTLELTAREREVALLVAKGLTNRQVARTLSISERTVANHVASILKKLGLASRVRIAAWAIERRLLEQGANR